MYGGDLLCGLAAVSLKKNLKVNDFHELKIRPLDFPAII